MPYIPASYSPGQVRPRIVHFGLGAFCRAHTAWACHELLQRGAQAPNDWGICALSVRGNTKVIQALEQQGYRYLLGIQQGSEPGPDQNTAASPAGQLEIHQVGSIVGGLDRLRDGLAALLAQIAAEETAILSFTITEKGYYLDPATRQLDEQHPDIRHDLEQPQQPQSILGILALGLEQRRRTVHAARAPVALMSCDNIPGNSQVLRRALLRLIELQGERSQQSLKLARWIEEACRFPCTMVDRITPAVSAETLAQLEQASGLRDPIALSTEGFTQWVIEDRFPHSDARPAWEQASGVVLVGSAEEVGLYEQMKLRLLNGSHSFLAYCGYLAGKEYIYQCMAEPLLKQACYRLIAEEQRSTLPAGRLQSVDLEAYSRQLLARYSNPQIPHRCYQIAMDGSLKVPQRWLDGYRTARQGSAHSWRFVPFGLAAWLQYLSGTDLQSRPIAVQDPNAAALRRLLEAAPRGQEARALFQFTPCFGDLCGDTALIAKVQQCYAAIRSGGLLAALRRQF